MKRVLVISSSLRKDSNSEQLAVSFADGASSAGHEVELVSLRDKEIRFCVGCLACQKTQRCFMHDDADAIREKMLYADVLVFATPIYYYEMSGILKTLLDRANPLYSSNIVSVRYMPLQQQPKMRNTFRKGLSQALRAGWTALKRQNWSVHCSAVVSTIPEK